MELNIHIRIRKSTTFQLGESPKDIESPKGISETVPDMSMSLKTLLDRHSRGIEIPQFKPMYSDIEIPDLAKMDLSEIQEYREHNAELIQHFQDLNKQAKSMEQQKQDQEKQRAAARSQKTPVTSTEEYSSTEE